MKAVAVARVRTTRAAWIAERVGPACALAAYLFAACAPTVKVEAPKEPITINLNVKIEHEIRVKVEKDLEDLFTKESELF